MNGRIDRPVPRGGVLRAALLLVLISAGCRQTQIYNAGSLPPELMAPSVGSVRNFDWSRLPRAVSDSEQLYPGDVVRVTITTGLEENAPEGWELRIAESGMSDIPLVGPVRLSGLRTAEAEQVIREESIRRGKFVRPSVAVVPVTRRSHMVTVMGAVEEPGTYELPSAQSDLLSAVVMAGGVTEEASTVIEIRNPPHVAEAVATGMNGPTQLASHQLSPMTPPETLRLDLADATADRGAGLRVFDGSTVTVMKKPPQFLHVIGLVNRADQFEIPDDTELRLLDAIALAGGLKLEVADKVHVIRVPPGSTQPVVIQASLKKAKRDGVSNIRLAPGDVVSVEQTPTTFVVGTVRDFVRFGFSSAMPGF